MTPVASTIPLSSSDGSRWFRAIVAGAGAGIVATAAMSAGMLVFQRLGLLGRMPPRHIVEHLLARAGLRQGTSREGRKALSAVSHIGFGATQGVLYALGHEAQRSLTGSTSRPAATTAVPFALLVWAVSYAGWIPKLGILPPPSGDRFGRPSSMILAHIVYGAVLGELSKRLWATPALPARQSTDHAHSSHGASRQSLRSGGS